MSHGAPRSDHSPSPSAMRSVIAPPKLNIVVMVIGSRGDIQPFVAVAKLVNHWGHRVRLATHPTFKELVKENGIEFFGVGGDPAELMAFMVKNPGLIPTYGSIKAGDITKHRDQMFDMFQGFWSACINPNPEDVDAYPFVADAIIANPPSFAHVHCAEKLGVPLHLMFTFPYSPTQTIPHPLLATLLSNNNDSNLAKEYTNVLTYPMVDMLVWQGLGDLVNKFRGETLGLEPVATLWAPGMIHRLKVPFSYMWSPALIPEPHDWEDHIDITGFVFLDLASNYSPPRELEEFLKGGPPPVYIGFGSIVVDDPAALTQTILDAVKQTGVRALLSKGWGDLGESEEQLPETVFILENTPHDWLFPKVEAVVHHGGAGTTAVGLYHGKPTMIVPFFGDQQFWGDMVANAGAGAPPVPQKELTVDRLVEGILKLLSEECKQAAARISRQIKGDDGDGAENAVNSFFRCLESLGRGKRGLGKAGKVLGEGGPRGPGEGKWGYGGPGINCSFLPEKVAVWRIRRMRTRLSSLAAFVLVRMGKLTWRDLRLVRHTEWSDYNGPGEPISGGVTTFFSSIASITRAFISLPLSCFTSHPREPFSSVARAPVDVSLAIAQGFHNAPRLVGDEVRHPDRITGIHSGLRAAGKEFSLGIYDGVTGIFTQPYHGAQREGVKGFLKGLGRGLAGGVLKTNAATAGVVGFTLKGVHREIRKGKDRQVADGIRRARIREGEAEWKLLAGKDREMGKEVEGRVEEGWGRVEEEKREREETDRRIMEKISGVKSGCGRWAVERVVSKMRD